MFSFFTKLFSRKAPEPVPSSPAAEYDVETARHWDEHKSRLMERTLGKEHGMVMHAIIPYAVGGALDLYYYPNGITGTGIATKELSEYPDQGSMNRQFACYELVMFTRHPVDLEHANNPTHPFGKAHDGINRILNRIAPYSAQASLNSGETCEFPADMDHVGGKCLVFDAYGHHSDDVVKSFGLLLVMEIFRSEMEYARANGSEALFSRLKAAGYYPYSDLDRVPVA